MNVLDWLLDADPAIRWQVLRDLVDAPSDEVAAERSRVANEGWGAELLALQDAGGTWDGGTYRPAWADDHKPWFDAWTATHFVLGQLHDFGVDPSDPAVRRAIGLVRDNVRWEANDKPYFVGEVEPCINGAALANAAYFGESGDAIVETLLAGQLADGGWNCWAEYGARVGSFHSTICVLEGLLEWEQAGGSAEAVTTARERGEEYLLERGLYRRRSTGEVADPRYTMFSFPTYWYHDVLRGLEYFRRARPALDERLADAIALVAAKADDEGRWPRENVHQGPTHLDMEGPEGFPSRWTTLRALRVLRWAGVAHPALQPA